MRAVSAAFALAALPAPLEAQQADTATAAAYVSSSGRVLQRLNPRETARLIEIDTVRIRGGQTVKVLLAQRGIVDDADALAWVYSANPELRNIDNLQIDQQLLLPRLRQADGAPSAPADRVALVVAPGVKEEIRTEAAAALATIRSAGDRGVEFPAQSRVREQVNEKAQELSQLDLSSSSLTPSVLEALRDQASLLREAAQLYATASAENAALEVLAEAVESSGNDLEALEKCLDAGRACRVTVTVRPVSEIDDKPVQGLQLRWAARARRLSRACADGRRPGCSRAFRVQSPRYETELVVHTGHFVWAVKNGRTVSCDIEVRPSERGPWEYTLPIPAADQPLTCTPGK